MFVNKKRNFFCLLLINSNWLIYSDELFDLLDLFIFKHVNLFNGMIQIHCQQIKTFTVKQISTRWWYTLSLYHVNIQLTYIWKKFVSCLIFEEIRGLIKHFCVIFKDSTPQIKSQN